MENGSRTQNSVRNVSIALIGQCVGILLQFISRRIFIDMMSVELLGVNSVFANILSVLSLAEMGIGSAITFSLYKPLAKKQYNKINSIMYFYKWIYRVIACAVLGFGVLLVPVLPVIIKDNIPHLIIYYFLYLASTVISYLCAYKRTLIIADQKGYISSLYRYTYIALLNICQVVVLIKTHNYVLYLIVQIVLSFGENILISRKADKLYPYLKEKAEKLSSYEKKEYYKNIKALLMHRIGSVVVMNTDSILLSAIVNINAASIYANYKLVFSGLNTIMSQLFSSLTASVGNLMQEREKEHSYKLYRSIEVLICWIYGVISICLIVLFNDFIKLWVGNDFVEKMDYVILLILIFFINGIREPTNMFKSANGLFWNDRYKAVIEAVVNIILSILMGILWGTRGIFAATVISALSIPFWVEPYVLYKNYWRRNVAEYFSLVGRQVITVGIVGFIIFFLASLINVASWGMLIVKGVVCFSLANILFMFVLRKTPEFVQIISIFEGILLKIRKLKKER